MFLKRATLKGFENERNISIFFCFTREVLVLGGEFIGSMKMKSKTSVRVKT